MTKHYTKEDASKLLLDVCGIRESPDGCDGLAMCLNEAMDRNSKWRPIDEAPRDGTAIVALFKNGEKAIVWFLHGDWEYAHKDEYPIESSPIGWVGIPTNSLV